MTTQQDSTSADEAPTVIELSADEIRRERPERHPGAAVAGGAAEELGIDLSRREPSSVEEV